MKADYSSTDERIKKHVIKHGSLKNKPLEGSVCELLIDNLSSTPVDFNPATFNSEILTGGKRVTFTIYETDCELDKLIERAVKWMGEGEQAEITINLSKEPEVVVVKFVATLKKHSQYKPIWEWTPEEKYKTAVRYKAKAVSLVEANRVVDAFHRFSNAVKLIITLEPIADLELDAKLEKDIENLRMSLYNNMAMCQLKHGNYDHVITLCSKVLKVQKNNVKAFYRRGTAYGAVKDVEKAFYDFQKAIHIQPSNFMLWDKLKIYRHLVEAGKRRSDEILKKMFYI